MRFVAALPGLATSIFGLSLSTACLSQEVITLGSGLSAASVLAGPADSGFGPFSVEDFAAAESGASASVIPPQASTWVQSLPPDAAGNSAEQWLTTQPHNRSGLYAIPFQIESPTFSDVELELTYSVDNHLGSTEVPGVYINGQAVSGDTHGLGWYTSSHQLSRNDIGSLCVPGHNVLHIYNFDFGGPSGLLFRATITVEDPTFGTGCPSSPAAPIIGVDGNGTVLGSSPVIATRNLLPNAGGYVLLGFPPALTQSVDLSALGMLGCQLHVRPDVSFPLSADSSGEACIALNLPDDPTLLSSQLFAQSFFADPAANTLGLSATPGLVISIFE